MRVGILAHEFLVNTGANDFLKNIIRGLSHDADTELVFLCPLSDQKIEHAAPANLKAQLGRYPCIKKLARSIAKLVGPIADTVRQQDPDEYAHYLEACSEMTILPCSPDIRAYLNIVDEMGLDVLMPSIHVLPPDLPHVNYWPDCQPKHLPEFFDEESQRVRDERIFGLLDSGKPMIINSLDAKRDMMNFYHASESQIFDLPFAPIIEIDRFIPRPELVSKYSVRRPYFIVCNQFWIHKSAETVIEAAAICKRKGMEVDFVFTGKLEEPRRPEYIDFIKDLVKKLNVEDCVKFFGYIPKADQIELMKNSISVVQPTLFEGGPGGGAVYDAYSLGVRSVVSDIPINRELPLEDGRIKLFAKGCPEDLAVKLEIQLDSPYSPPSYEDLYQQTKTSTQKLSVRIKEAISSAVD